VGYKNNNIATLQTVFTSGYNLDKTRWKNERPIQNSLMLISIVMGLSTAEWFKIVMSLSIKCYAMESTSIDKVYDSDDFVTKT
jgi:hypothetical protein